MIGVALEGANKDRMSVLGSSQIFCSCIYHKTLLHACMKVQSNISGALHTPGLHMLL